MKKLSLSLPFILLFLITSNEILAQAPTLGSAANFALFTSVGAITNTGISQITGNVGSNVGAGTGFGNVNGVMHSGNGITSQSAADLNTAYNQLNAAIPNFFVAPLLGNGDTLVAGVYNISGASTLSGDLILNGQGDPNAVFIFQIQAAFSSTAASKLILINGALACNVFWKVEGLVDLAAGTFMRGTIIAHNAGINLNALDTLEGIALSTTGAISLNGVMAFIPSGCGSPSLSGPLMPGLGSAACYTLFTSNGAMTNAGVSNVIGDVGTNVGLTSGFNPLFVNGSIHSIPDGSTAAAAADLLNASNLMNIMPYDIELLYPAQFGNDLVLTPHTYILNAATSLTGNIFLNAQGNANAVFFIKIYGALATSVASKVILINGAQADNVYWLVNGAVEINSSSIFNGNLISINGAINILPTSTQLNGRLLTTNGAFSTSAIAALSMSPCFALPLNWLYFDGQPKLHEVLLRWGTSNEINNKYYLIEKSKDGLSFDLLTRVIAENENVNLKNEYEFIDHTPFPTTYYRISQIDVDEHTETYKTIKVFSTEDELVVTHHVISKYIDISITNAFAGRGVIELFTMQGERVSSLDLLLNSELTHYQINKPLNQGLYLLRITEEDKTIYTGKILVN
ncbi:MAG: DUF3494 domain-containing protein [Chitinophagaceae bacterium]|nr:DUF3494 domain-containing protein [Chitinophagaceae bacterium]